MRGMHALTCQEGHHGWALPHNLAMAAGLLLVRPSAFSTLICTFSNA